MSPTAAIRGATVLAGHDLKPMHDAAVVLDGTTIAGVEHASGTTALLTIDASNLVLLPGFIDAHVHIGFAIPRDVVVGGVTTVRDLAWPPEQIWPLVRASAEPSYPGPQVFAAGQMLTTEGGYPLRAEWAPPRTGRVVVGPGDAHEAVAEQADAGAVVIKVALNPAVGPTLDELTLAAIVDAAHGRGLKVTGHVWGLAELRKALNAGMDELAHMLMSPEPIPAPLLDEMVRSGMTIVPTLSIFFGAAQEIAIENLWRFVEAGGRVVYGTDLGNQGPQPGIDEREVEALARAGLSGIDIVRSATVEAAEWLGFADRGHIAPGAAADLVAVEGDPATEPLALTRVRMVWRGGHLVFPRLAEH
ncbi:MAG: amidohydrolase family protein [Actinomycetota bacterium]